MDVDTRPLQLRAADQADAIPMLVIEMSNQLAALFDEGVQARDLQQRAIAGDDHRRKIQVRDRLVEHVDSLSEARSHFEILVQSLRAGGRL